LTIKWAFDFLNLKATLLH